jgi:hypothetical protein
MTSTVPAGWGLYVNPGLGLQSPTSFGNEIETRLPVDAGDMQQLTFVAVTYPMSEQIIGPNGAPMADPTREEIDAKLAAVEARTETRFVELSSKIDRVADAVGNLTTSVDKALRDVKRDLDDVRADNKTTRWTIGTTIVIALLAAIGALWVTQANLLAAFTAGLAAH